MPNRPQPRFPEPNTEYFWEGCKEGELRYQVNDATGEVVFYPRLHDPKPDRVTFHGKYPKVREQSTHSL